MKIFIFSLLTLAYCQIVTAADSFEKFITVEETAEAKNLRTANVTYKKGHQAVTLIGAIHIADQNYYETLNEEFKKYDTLLFEMIGGEDIKNRKKEDQDVEPLNKKEGGDPFVNMLGSFYKKQAKTMGLVTQSEHIDYNLKNFVHADMTQAEFDTALIGKNESIFGAAFAMQAEAEQPNFARLLNAMLTENANGLKRELLGTMNSIDKLDAFTGGSVILVDRNIAAFKVLDQYLNKGAKKIGVFYGAAHFQDMQQRLLDRGFTLQNHTWLTAWHVPNEDKKK